METRELNFIGQNFQDMSRKVVEIVLKRYGLERTPVVYNAKGTYTDGIKIYVSGEVGKLKEETANRISMGKIDHEIGHLLFSSFSPDTLTCGGKARVYAPEYDAKMGFKDPIGLTNQLIQAIEDWRITKELDSVFFGAYDNMRVGYFYYQDEYVPKMAGHMNTKRFVFHRLAFAIFNSLMSDTFILDAERYSDFAVQICSDKNVAAMFSKFRDWGFIAKCHAATCSENVIDLVFEFRQKLQEELEREAEKERSKKKDERKEPKPKKEKEEKESEDDGEDVDEDNEDGDDEGESDEMDDEESGDSDEASDDEGDEEEDGDGSEDGDGEGDDEIEEEECPECDKPLSECECEDDDMEDDDMPEEDESDMGDDGDSSSDEDDESTESEDESDESEDDIDAEENDAEENDADDSEGEGSDAGEGSDEDSDDESDSEGDSEEAAPGGSGVDDASDEDGSDKEEADEDKTLEDEFEQDERDLERDDFDMSKMVNDATSGSSRDTVSFVYPEEFRRKYDKSYNVSEIARKTSQWATKQYDDILNQDFSVVRRLANEFNSRVFSYSEQRRDVSRDKGRFRRSELLKLSSFEGYQSEFPRTDLHREFEFKDIACTILVDNSGSMNGQNIRIARKLSVLLSEVLASLDIPFEVKGFTGRSVSTHSITYTGRRHSCEIITYKDFSGSNRKLVGHIAGESIELSENPDGAAIEYASVDLFQRKEDRRIMFFISDGAPVGYDSSESAFEHVRVARETLEANGIEFYSIGLDNYVFSTSSEAGRAKVDRIYGKGKWVNFSNFSDEGKALEQLFVTTILKFY